MCLLFFKSFSLIIQTRVARGNVVLMNLSLFCKGKYLRGTKIYINRSQLSSYLILLITLCLNQQLQYKTPEERKKGREKIRKKHKSLKGLEKYISQPKLTAQKTIYSIYYSASTAHMQTYILSLIGLEKDRITASMTQSNVHLPNMHIYGEKTKNWVFNDREPQIMAARLSLLCIL